MFLFILLFTSIRVFINLNTQTEIGYYKNLIGIHLLNSITSGICYYFEDYTLFDFLVVCELSFYFSDIIVELYKKDIENVLHHLITLGLFNIALYLNYKFKIIQVVFVFSLSSVLLNLSKTLHKLEYNLLSKVLFLLFTIVFFITRIFCSFFILMDVLHEAESDLYLKVLSILLYSLQIFWFKKIIKFIRKNF